MASVAALTFGVLTVAPASAATVTVTEDALSINPATPTTSSSVQAALTVHASATLSVQDLTVAVRSADGTNYDFTGAAPEILTTSPLTFHPNPRTFPAGTYTYFGAYEVGGVWKNLAAHSFTVAATTPAGSAPVGMPGSWTNTFDDEFHEALLADDPNWSTTSPFGKWDAATNTWCATGPTQQLSAGQLVLQAVNESCDGSASALTGGIISTDPGSAASPVTVSPGDAVEAQLYLSAAANGITNWPAFWLYGQDPWPTNGEIDVMEGLLDTDVTPNAPAGCYHIHYGTTDNPQGPGGCAPGANTGWHTFGMDWQSNGTVTFYYDGINVGSEYLNTTSPQFIILDLATHTETTTTTGTTGEMKAAYVRAWTPA